VLARIVRFADPNTAIRYPSHSSIYSLECRLGQQVQRRTKRLPQYVQRVPMPSLDRFPGDNRKATRARRQRLNRQDMISFLPCPEEIHGLTIQIALVRYLLAYTSSAKTSSTCYVTTVMLLMDVPSRPIGHSNRPPDLPQRSICSGWSRIKQHQRPRIAFRRPSRVRNPQDCAESDRDQKGASSFGT